MKKRQPALAAICSLIEPGLGLVYTGAIKEGLALSAAILIIHIGLMFTGIFRSYYATITTYALLILGVRLTMAVISARRAKQVGSIELSRFNRWYIYSLFALLPIAPAEVISVIRDFFPLRVMVMTTVSMQPSIQPDEWIVADMHYYNTHPVLPGDVVVFRSPLDSTAPYAKRCVAVANQKVQIRDGILFVNEQQFDPSLPLARTTSTVFPHDLQDERIRPVGAGNEDHYGPVIVPNDSYFLLGDHRDMSLDSRFFGFIKKEDILGKVLYIFYSDSLDRIGKDID